MVCFRMTSEEELVRAHVWDVVGRRWMPRVLRLLSDGRPHRFSEILMALGGISTKTLCIRLEELGDSELVEKVEYAEVPPRVEYFLTAKGRDLCSVICQLDNFAVKWERREIRIVRRKR